MDVDESFLRLMSGMAGLNHGNLKLFASLVRRKLTGHPSPDDAQFCDAIYEAAKSLAKEDAQKDNASKSDHPM